MKPLTPRQKTLIVNSFKTVFLTGDIEKLTPAAYKYIYQASGFIAHYNLHGFRDAYREVTLLKQDILRQAESNLWKNFSPQDKDYDYYMEKSAVYRSLVSLSTLP